MKRKMVVVLLSGILAASSLTCVQSDSALIAVAAETSETKTFKIERTNVPIYNNNGVSIVFTSCNYTQDASNVIFEYELKNETKNIMKMSMDNILIDGVEMSMYLGNSFESKAGQNGSLWLYIAMEDLINAGVSDFAQITYTLNISLGDEQVASIPIVIERKESTVTSDAGNDEAVKTLESEKAELEEKVSQLESENTSLESENDSLKKQVEELKNGEATDQTETDEQTESADETESEGKEQTEDSKPEETEETELEESETEEKAEEETEVKETKAKEASVGMSISEFVSRYNTTVDDLNSLTQTKIEKITEDSVRTGKIITNNNGIIKLKIDSDGYIYEMSFEEEFGENLPTYELVAIVAGFDNLADNGGEAASILQKALYSESPNSNIRYKQVGDNNRIILSGVYNTKNNVPLEDKTSVSKAQRALNKLGYNCGTADGILGSNTQKAIVAFQKNNDLTPTGEITQELLQKLSWNSATSSSTNSKRSLEDYSDTLVQNLKSLAIYNPIEVTDKENDKYGLKYTLKFKGIEISLETGESDDKEEFWIIAFNETWDKEPFYDFAAYLVQAVSPEIDAYDAYTIVINANAADGYQKNGCHYTGVDGSDLVIENIPR